MVESTKCLAFPSVSQLWFPFNQHHDCSRVLTVFIYLTKLNQTLKVHRVRYHQHNMRKTAMYNNNPPVGDHIQEV